MNDTIDWTALLALVKRIEAEPVDDQAEPQCVCVYNARARTPVPALVAMVRGLAGALERIAGDPSRYEYEGATREQRDAAEALATIPAALRADP